MLKTKLDTEKLTIEFGLFFSKFGLSPNKWTFISLVLAIFGFFSLYSFHNLLIALCFFVFAGFLDMVDGAVARVTGRASEFGAFLDGIIDRYVEFLLYLGLLFYGVNYFWISVLIFGSIMPSFITAYSHHRGVITEKKNHKKMGGIMERAERLILIYIGMGLAIIYNDSGLFLNYIIILAGILSNFTAFQRIIFVFRREKE